MIESEPNETYAQYSFRLAREARLRKEAIANEAIDRKRKRTERSKEERRKERENRRQIRPVLLELAGVAKKKLEEVAKAKAEKAAEIEDRKQARLCVCCGDDRDIKQSGHCQECWNEIYHGIIKQSGVSERQVHSAACRVIRKATGMS